MSAPVCVSVFTARRQPYLAHSSAAEVIVTLLFEVRARGGVRLHAFAVLPNEVHLVLTPLTISTRAMLANWMTETEPLLKALIDVAGPVWEVNIMEEPLTTSRAVQEALHKIEQMPVQANLAPQPEAYRFCSAHPRFRAEMDPVAPASV